LCGGDALLAPDVELLTRDVAAGVVRRGADTA
jgi:hypothetical protein